MNIIGDAKETVSKIPRQTLYDDEGAYKYHDSGTKIRLDAEGNEIQKAPLYENTIEPVSKSITKEPEQVYTAEPQKMFISPDGKKFSSQEELQKYNEQNNLIFL